MATLALLALLTACTGGSTNLFELTVTPVVADNQSTLLEELDSLVLTITPADGEPIDLEVGSLGEGQSTPFAEIEGQEDATLTFRGFVGSDIAAFGRSEPLTFGDGPQSIEIFVGAVDGLAELASLDEGRSLGALASDDSGRFFLFGGSPEAVNVTELDDGIYALDMAPPSQNLDFVRLDEPMPPLDDDIAGRMGHTATALTRGSHDLLGRILVAGGAAGITISSGTSTTNDASTVSDSAFLFDPATDTATPLSESATLVRRRALHTAHELPTGDVIVVGGIGRASSGWIFEDTAEVFDPDSGTFDLIEGDPEGPLLFHAAAALGDDEVLACGGLEAASNNQFRASYACDIINRSGSFLDAPGLPDDRRIVHAAMAPLPTGEVLLTGGFAPGDTADSLFGFGGEPATNESYIFDGSSWTPLGDDGMKIPRAMHRMLPLANGDVLVVGGVSEGENGFPGVAYGSEHAIACAEVYDWESGRFRVLGDCDPDASVGAMSEARALPAVALDRTWGAMVVGGADRNGDGANGADFYVPVP